MKAPFTIPTGSAQGWSRHGNLFSNAVLDLGPEPRVFAWPGMGSRRYLFPMLDGRADVVASPGTRTAGEGARSCLLTGPRHTGPVPAAGMARVGSPTGLLRLLGRTYRTGTPEASARCTRCRTSTASCRSAPRGAAAATRVR
jgi:hypothetical protein